MVLWQVSASYVDCPFHDIPSRHPTRNVSRCERHEATDENDDCNSVDTHCPKESRQPQCGCQHSRTKKMSEVALLIPERYATFRKIPGCVVYRCQDHLLFTEPSGKRNTCSILDRWMVENGSHRHSLHSYNFSSSKRQQHPVSLHIEELS
jgi:hypothetical protein